MKKREAKEGKRRERKEWLSEGEWEREKGMRMEGEGKERGEKGEESV